MISVLPGSTSTARTEADSARVNTNQDVRLVHEVYVRSRGYSPTFHLPIALRIDKSVSAEHVEGHLRELFDRSVELRRVFFHAPEIDPSERKALIEKRFVHRTLGPCPLFTTGLSTAELAVSRIDCNDSASRAATAIHAAAQELYDAPFELFGSLLSRAAIISCSDCTILLVVTSRLIADSASSWPMTDRFRARIAGDSDAPTMPAAEPIPRLASAQHIDYWRTLWLDLMAHQVTIRDAPLAMPRGPAAALASLPSGLCEMELPPTVAEQITRCAEEARAKFVSVFLACHAILIARFTGKLVFPIWTRFNGRRDDEAAAIGWYSKCHAIPVNLTAVSCGLELVEAMDATVAIGSVHQYCHLSEVWTAVDRCLERGVRMACVVDEEEPRNLVSPTCTRIGIDIVPKADIDFQIGVHARADGIALRLTYSRALFRGRDAMRMLRTYAAIIMMFAGCPSTSIAHLRDRCEGE